MYGGSIAFVISNYDGWDPGKKSDFAGWVQAMFMIMLIKQIRIASSN